MRRMKCIEEQTTIKCNLCSNEIIEPDKPAKSDITCDVDICTTCWLAIPEKVREHDEIMENLLWGLGSGDISVSEFRKLSNGGLFFIAIHREDTPTLVPYETVEKLKSDVESWEYVVEEESYYAIIDGVPHSIDIHLTAIIKGYPIL